MSNYSIADASLLDLIAQIPSDRAADLNILMYDTEPTPFQMKNPMAFDIGFKSFSPFGGTRGKGKGGLVYEIMRDKEIMGHLTKQRKISNAASDEYFYVMQYLANQDDARNPEGLGWYSHKIDDTPNYGQRTRETFIDEIYKHLKYLNSTSLPASVQVVDRDNMQDMYEDISRHLSVTRESIAHFEKQEVMSDSTKKVLRDAIDREKVKEDMLNTFMMYMQNSISTQTALDAIKASNEQMHSVVRSFRYKQFVNYTKNVVLGGDLNYKQDLEDLKRIPGGENIKPMKQIMEEYKKELEGTVGVMGHNINKDLGWTRATLKAIPGMSNYEKYVDENEIEAYCSLLLLKRLYSLEGTELLQVMFKLNKGEIYDKLKADLDSDSLPPMAGKGFSLEALYRDIISDKTPQKHSAMADVDWTIDIVQKVAESIVQGELAERK